MKSSLPKTDARCLAALAEELRQAKEALKGLDTRFVRANHTAVRILGITPEQVAGTYGRTFIPDTPDAHERLRLALESIGRGTETSGVVLGLRRRDNGPPIFIQKEQLRQAATVHPQTAATTP